MATTTKSVRINLLRPAERRKPSKLGAMPALPTVSMGGSRYVQLAAVVLVLEVAGLGVWMWGLHREEQGYTREIAKLRKQDQDLQKGLEQLRQVEASKRDIQRRLEIIGRVAKSQGLPVAMMNGVLGAVPEGLWLTDFTVKAQEVRRQIEVRPSVPYSDDTLGQLQEKKAQAVAAAPAAAPAGQPQQKKEVTELEGFSITIKGMAFNNFQVAEFMDNLRDAGVFADVDFTVTQAASVEQVRVMNFEVTASVKL